MRVTDLTPRDWMGSALCAQVDPDLHYPGKGDTVREARAICNQCEVILACRDYADSIEPDGPDLLFGLWGGESPAERYERRVKARSAA